MRHNDQSALAFDLVDALFDGPTGPGGFGYKQAEQMALAGGDLHAADHVKGVTLRLEEFFYPFGSFQMIVVGDGNQGKLTACGLGDDTGRTGPAISEIGV